MTKCQSFGTGIFFVFEIDGQVGDDVIPDLIGNKAIPDLIGNLAK